MTDPVKIKIIGVGGAGINTVNQMIKNGLTGVEFCVMEADKKSLAASDCENKLLLGAKTLNGLSVGGDIILGEEAAKEYQQDIKNAIEGADMVFIIAGMGGGMGTGAAPVIAKIAKEMRILTIAIVSKPFSWEGRKRQERADLGIKELKDTADAIAVIPNDKLPDVINRQYSVHEAFSISDEILFKFVQTISDIVTLSGMINIEFDDFKKVLKNAGFMSIGIGQASGENRAAKATRMAINSKLSEHFISESTGIILNIKGDSNLTMAEVSEVTGIIDSIDEDTTVIIGTIIDESIQDAVQITVIAAGFDKE